ncbi:hypothetical protein BJX68DRAFT_267282 [Aspergillus pseudodeflectus]|uniref:Rhodopsin domain-containing protein n=1 Tax=Aspergillus pseudodeflectus TaxID=176178 RepID=A0ABR4KCE7_9EURO
MPMIRNLQMSLREKIALSAIFLLGAFVLVTGAVRISYAYNPGDAQLALDLTAMWSVINIGTGILCACLPTFPPLLAKARDLYRSLHSRGSQGSSATSIASRKASAIQGNAFHGMNGKAYSDLNGSTLDTVPLTQITGSREMENSMGKGFTLFVGFKWSSLSDDLYQGSHTGYGTGGSTFGEGAKDRS